MFWTTCSSPSTKPAKRPCESVKCRLRRGISAIAVPLAIAAVTSFAPATALAAKRAVLEPAKPVAVQMTGVFRSLEFVTNADSGLASWHGALRKLAREEASYAKCDVQPASCDGPLRVWRGKLAKWRMLSQDAQLILVNRFANATIRYTDDRVAFRRADHWASPLESLKGRGDCEDYALLKYASLRALGFGEDQLRLVIVNDLQSGLPHAVLSVRTGQGTFILDNQDARVMRHDTIRRYAPVYSVNAKGRWINIATRELKPRKTAPVVLVASLGEISDVASLAALAPPSARTVPLPKLRPAALGAAQPVAQVVLKPRLQAAAVASLLQAPQRASVVSAASAKVALPPRVNINGAESLFASVMRPILSLAQRFALI